VPSGTEAVKELIRDALATRREEVGRLESALSILEGKPEPPVPRRRRRRAKAGNGRRKKRPGSPASAPTPPAGAKPKRRTVASGGNLKERTLAVLRECPDGLTHKQLAEAVEQDPEGTYLYTIVAELKKEKLVFRDGNSIYATPPLAA
jgi:hypothetical protein